ncbi:hypothetical protein Tco_1002795 [Tanacetum coccineum]|uniref:Uncharacterized protein n=1 Tax=Tanacetum coccineum TaxID=301880 RepID=A0ABQ5F968_9ASTR
MIDVAFDMIINLSSLLTGKVIEENKDPEVRIAIVIGPAIIHDDEGLCVFVPMPGMKNNHVNVTVENNLLLCIGTRPDGKPATCIPEYGPKSLLPNKSYKRVRLEARAWQQCGTYHCMVELPDKTYTPSEVEAKMKDCVLRLSFSCWFINTDKFVGLAVREIIGLLGQFDPPRHEIDEIVQIVLSHGANMEMICGNLARFVLI